LTQLSLDNGPGGQDVLSSQLAVDLNGVIVEAPFIQPANASFSSFEGQMQLSAVTKSDASDLAAL